jgi:hypothetical protein
MTQDFRLADVSVRADLGVLALTEYAASSLDTLLWYDGDAAGSAEGVTTAVLGRAAFIDARLTRTEAVALLGASASAPWDTVPVDATLAAADDKVRDGLYDAAERLHRHFLDAEGRVGATTISTVLHLTRPGLFPILDSTVRQLYARRAEAAWQAETRTERPYSGKSYWPAIREDLTAATDVLQGWRSQLSTSGEQAHQVLARLSDVRLWDVVTREIAAAGQRIG